MSKTQQNFNGEVHIGDPEIVESAKGVVAADDARCSKVGASMLRRGGHAIDAAVATALCVGVVNPMASGIGGGAFMVVRSASTSEALAFDMRETAPAAASEVPSYSSLIIFVLYFMLLKNLRDLRQGRGGPNRI